MKRVLTAVVLIPVVLLLVFKAPLWLFSLTIAAIIALTLREYLDITEAAGIKPFRWLTYVTALVPVLVLCFQTLSIKKYLGPSLIPIDAFVNDELIVRVCSIVLLLSSIIFGVPLVFRKDLKNGLAASASSVFGVAYIGISLTLLVALRTLPQEILVIFSLFSVWAGDIAAYYVGKNIGRHKLAPVVSPNKSWEGAIASVAGSILVGILIFHFRASIEGLFANRSWNSNFYSPVQSATRTFLDVSWMHVICLGIITNVAAQLGDLFESALKRGAGVKDSGTLLPGHGGILDRIDALVFAIPVVWYYANLTGFLHPNS